MSLFQGRVEAEGEIGMVNFDKTICQHCERELLLNEHHECAELLLQECKASAEELGQKNKTLGENIEELQQELERGRGKMGEYARERIDRQNKEIAKLEDVIQGRTAINNAFGERIAQLEEELKQYQCLYCGKLYKADPTADELAAHIFECPKHPIARFKEKIAELEEALEAHETSSVFWKEKYLGRWHCGDDTDEVSKLRDIIRAKDDKIKVLEEENQRVSKKRDNVEMFLGKAMRKVEALEQAGDATFSCKCCSGSVCDHCKEAWDKAKVM